MDVQISASASGYEGDATSIRVIDDESLTPWRNPRNILDVNDDGFVSPIDALLIINLLNSPSGAGNLPPTIPNPFIPPRYVDTSGDNFLSPIDALLIINFLNQGSVQDGASGEDLQESDAFALVVGLPHEEPPMSIVIGGGVDRIKKFSNDERTERATSLARLENKFQTHHTREEFEEVLEIIAQDRTAKRILRESGAAFSSKE